MPLFTGDQPLSPFARRSFGAAMCGAMWLLAFLLYATSSTAAWVLVAVGSAWLVAYYAWPSGQLQLIRWWRWLTWPLAWLVGHLLLASVYFGVLLPIALWRRSCDSLQLRSEGRNSGWHDKRQTEDEAEYFRQF